MTATVLTEPQRVHDVILWEEGRGDQRYTRKQATFKNVDSNHAAVMASGTLSVTSPTAVIALAAQSGGLYADEAGNLGAITLDVVDGVSEGVAYADGVLTVTVNITGASHNTVNALNTVLTASANWVSTVTSGGAGTITGSTAGTVTLAGGEAAVAVTTEFQVGTPLDFVTDHYEPVTQVNESSTAAVLLSHIKDIADDEEVEVSVLFSGPAQINMDALSLFDPYTNREAVMAALEALTPYSIDRVNEPVQQTSGTED